MGSTSIQNYLQRLYKYYLHETLGYGCLMCGVRAATLVLGPRVYLMGLEREVLLLLGVGVYAYHCPGSSLPTPSRGVRCVDCMSSYFS